VPALIPALLPHAVREKGNRACPGKLEGFGGGGRNRTGVHGFAVRILDIQIKHLRIILGGEECVCHPHHLNFSHYDKNMKPLIEAGRMYFQRPSNLLSAYLCHGPQCAYPWWRAQRSYEAAGSSNSRTLSLPHSFIAHLAADLGIRHRQSPSRCQSPRRIFAPQRWMQQSCQNHFAASRTHCLWT
jgi:hypothetical protein